MVKSTDFGVTWMQTGTGLTSTNISTILVDPYQANRVYVGTSDQGLFVSQDGGAHWSQAQSEFLNLNVGSLAAGSAAGSVYVGSLGNGVLESYDAGGTLVDGIRHRLGVGCGESRDS